MEQKYVQDRKIGIFYFGMFLILIIAGIVEKRVFGHPEFMMMFHLPAAIFLVLGGMKVTRRHREKMTDYSLSNLENKK